MARSSGWTPERQAKQAEAIQRWKPWEKSTGPRTAEGKARSSKNGFLSVGLHESRANFGMSRRLVEHMREASEKIMRAEQRVAKSKETEALLEELGLL